MKSRRARRSGRRRAGILFRVGVVVAILAIAGAVAVIALSGRATIVVNVMNPHPSESTEYVLYLDGQPRSSGPLVGFGIVTVELGVYPGPGGACKIYRVSASSTHRVTPDWAYVRVCGGQTVTVDLLV